jgi:hypothetical protein
VRPRRASLGGRQNTAAVSRRGRGHARRPKSSAGGQREQDEKALMPSWSPTSFVVRTRRDISAQQREQPVSEPTPPALQAAPLRADQNVSSCRRTRPIDAHRESRHGTRDEDYSPPPAQIPGCAANAPGSPLGFWRPASLPGALRFGPVTRSRSRSSAAFLGRERREWDVPGCPGSSDFRQRFGASEDATVPCRSIRAGLIEK